MVLHIGKMPSGMLVSKETSQETDGANEYGLAGQVSSSNILQWSST